MTIQEALRWGITQLRAAKVETPELDAEVLLQHTFHSAIPQNRRMNRSWLYAHSNEEFSGTAFSRYKKLVARRVKREPVAYIVGYKEFYGLDFLVNHDVLIPRAETELLVEMGLSELVRCQVSGVRCQFVDIGTGSGAIAVAIAKQVGIAHESARQRELSLATPQLRFFATDISASALCVAKKNARRHGVEKQITFLKGNLLEPLLVKAELWREKSSALLITANLPYLPTAEWRVTMPEVKKWEPRGALDGGKDGLKYYRELFKQVRGFVHNPPQPSLTLREGDRSILPLRVRGSERGLRITVLCEICPEQTGAFKELVRGYFSKAKCEVVKDLAGRNRVMVVKI